ncbi:MAG: hypothetical protein ACLQDV_25255 [Candidatus Binataceae bacterium]
MSSDNLTIEYGFAKNLVSGPAQSEKHAAALALLQQAKTTGRISEFTMREREGIEPEDDRDRELLEEITQFSLRYQVGLKKAFGSKTYHFEYFPPQNLLVRENERLVGVFPCVLETRWAEPVPFLEAFVKGRAWSLEISRTRRGKGAEQKLVDWIREDPNRLETGLRCVGYEVRVAGPTGLSRRIDLIFCDSLDRYLLVEVKAGVAGLDKAVGQILIQRGLFIRENFLNKGLVRFGIACAEIFDEHRVVCADAGIECFVAKISQ